MTNCLVMKLLYYGSWVLGVVLFLAGYGLLNRVKFITRTLKVSMLGEFYEYISKTTKTIELSNCAQLLYCTLFIAYS